MQFIDAATLSDAALGQILSSLSGGGVIAFPTDTAYGLGANPFDTAAVRRIFAIKGRPETKPVLLLVDSVEMAASVAHLSDLALSVAEGFWPGPLTLILPARDCVPELVTAGTRTVGVRWPGAALPIRLLKGFGKPITATSANRSGMAACVTAAEVMDQLGDDVDIVVDGGDLPFRGGSTILDLTGEHARVLREGPISKAELSEFLSVLK